MIKRSKIAALILFACFITYIAVADRGGFGRRNKIHFNIVTLNTLKNSIGFNLKSGLTFRGNTILNQQQVGNSIFSHSLISFQKGNTIYILPYKQKVITQAYSPSTGYKLVIRPK
jgi:hypothetical protein